MKKIYASADRKFGLLNIIRRTSVPRSILGIVGAGVGGGRAADKGDSNRGDWPG